MSIAFVIAAVLVVAAIGFGFVADHPDLGLGLFILAMVAFIIGAVLAMEAEADACEKRGGHMVNDGGAVVIMPPGTNGGVGQVVPTTKCSVEALQ